MSKLFTTLKLNSTHHLKNRLAVAPMTTEQSNNDGTLGAADAQWLERLANDGYGLVISCATAISQDSIAFNNQLSIESDAMLPALTELANKMKMNGSINIIQLCHAGSRSIKTHPYSASSYSMPDIPNFTPPKTLSENQIKTIISDFARACERVSKAGFDGIEFHGANGYLFTQFISQMTNLREDMYGGNLQNRARFSREVVRACRKAVPKDFILGFRISFENAGLEKGLDIDENIQIVNWLDDDGIDYIHISNLYFAAKSIKYPEEVAMHYIKERINNKLPLIGVGGITNKADAEKAMNFGADIVAIGRAAIGNKNLPVAFAKDEPLQFEAPFTEAHLKELGFNENFTTYLRRMPVAALNIVK